MVLAISPNIGISIGSDTSSVGPMLLVPSEPRQVAINNCQSIGGCGYSSTTSSTTFSTAHNPHPTTKN
ncbi:GD20453 [Drosophila simulans]|uniref:GD20453 n=1 Tax=Drosophila simulans TaxID=7240 RepID=B4R0H4_DROSI|nr:GD20453 [Drosophila simulans]